MDLDLDFSFYLLLGTIISGVVWGGYLLHLKAKGEQFSEETEPVAVEYARSFFPILLIVLLLRSFLVEPFRIPSGSMMPTLLVGDFILVNKFTYGIRLPVINKKIIPVTEPKRGDIVVFRFPKDPSMDYIKRVIGLPGDKIVYENKKLTINGQSVGQVLKGYYQGLDETDEMNGADRRQENLLGVEHDILTLPQSMSKEGVYVVPEGKYFVMGDNRDNSNDGRYWGFVPEENLLGKAFFIWLSWDWHRWGFIGFDRIGTVLH